MKQQSFLPKLSPRGRLDHGGDLGRGRRKAARPFSHKNAMHLVLRSSRARGAWSMLAPRNVAWIEKELQKCARRYRIRIYRFVNVGNHLHLLVKTEARGYLAAQRDFQSFLRRAAGQIAFRMMGAKKNEAKGRFWDQLAYSRIVSWGREFEALKTYLIKNLFEAKGFWNRKRSPDLELISISWRKAGVGPPS